MLISQLEDPIPERLGAVCRELREKGKNGAKTELLILPVAFIGKAVLIKIDGKLLDAALLQRGVDGYGGQGVDVLVLTKIEPPHRIGRMDASG